MGQRTPVPCNAPGCPVLIPPGVRYCVRHKAEMHRAYDARRNDKSDPSYDAHRKFYKSQLWLNCRKMHLRSNPLCVQCEAPGWAVDHITPIAEGGARVDPINLQTLCQRCHSIKTRIEVGARRRERQGG